jgi:hypothetical protein
MTKASDMFDTSSNAAAKAQREAAPDMQKETRPKSGELAVNQQTAETTALSVAASKTAGSQLAIAEGKALVLGYAVTSKRIASTIEGELQKLREQRLSAITSAPISPDLEESDFLLEFESDLSAAIAGI